LIDRLIERQTDRLRDKETEENSGIRHPARGEQVAR